MAVHKLKTWPEYFQAVKSGRKAFEVRRNDDRDFCVGDVLHLQEWSPVSESYTGGEWYGMITYILPGGQFDLPGNLCVMSLTPLCQQAMSRCETNKSVWATTPNK